MWKHLPARRFSGFKFGRPQPFEKYVADFCSFEAKLIIELDGGQHGENVERDKLRTKFLAKKGFRVIRFWDNEVFDNINGVQEHILQNLIITPHPGPRPQGAREVEKEKRKLPNKG